MQTDRVYLFTVSTLEPRKNFDRLLAARHGFPPVIAGGRSWGEAMADTFTERARRDGWSHPTASADVSLHEGFGLLIVDAMACGAPVVASRSTAVGETAGCAALLVEPEDMGDIATALNRII